MKFYLCFILWVFCKATFAVPTPNLAPILQSKYVIADSSKDTIPPVVYCLVGPVLVNLDSNLCIIIKAKEFDRGSYDNVTPVDKLKYYISWDTLVDSIKICCTDFLASGVHDEYLVNVKLTVLDEANNSASCNTTLIINDNFSICSTGDPGSGELLVKISTEENEYVNCDVRLSLDGQFIGNAKDDFNQFKYLKKGTYQICLAKNDNPLNGVSTADVVKIRRHILGLNSLMSPYKQIAADVNLSQTITTADVTEIRRLILGVIPEFQKISSWVFVGKDSFNLIRKFILPSVFSEFCDSIIISEWKLYEKEAIGIKMGDVTNSARGSDMHGLAGTRAFSKVVEIENFEIANDKIVTILSYSGSEKLSGLQFKLKFNSDDFQFENFEIGELDIKDEHVNLERLNLGELSVAWDGLDDEFNERNYPVLFKIIWKRKGTHHNQLNLSLIPYQIPPLIVDQSLNENYFSLEQVQGGSINLTHEFIASYSNYELVLISNKVISVRSNLSINDIAGNLLYTDKLLFESGQLVKKINIVLNPGIYTISISGNGKNQILKLLVPR